MVSISVVTPNYNCGGYIGATLQSVISQKTKSTEYIVVDGASGDDSMLHIKQFEQGVDMLICEPDSGHASALNKGFAASSGEVMGWLNSDDILIPGALTIIDDIFSNHPDIDWLTGRPTACSEQGVIYAVLPPKTWSRARFLAGDCRHIQQESTFWRRSLWDKVGGRLDETLKFAIDFDLWLRFFRHAELHTVSALIGSFRRRRGQISWREREAYDAECGDLLLSEIGRLPAEFREMYADVLPAHPKVLTQAETAALQGRLASEDKPVLRYDSEINQFVRDAVEDLPIIALEDEGAWFDGLNLRELTPPFDFADVDIVRFSIDLSVPSAKLIQADKLEYGKSSPPMPFIIGPVKMYQLPGCLFSLSISGQSGDRNIPLRLTRAHQRLQIILLMEGGHLRVSVNGKIVLDAPGFVIKREAGHAKIGGGFMKRFWRGGVASLTLGYVYDNGDVATWTPRIRAPDAV